jgi:saccharopine dehydrogenase-like NADP-dependent oxidoreductase
MRIWLIGAGQAGSAVLRQLRKNEEIEVIVTAVTDTPQAVKDGVLGKVDYVESVTALNINALARRIRPDLILVDASVNSIGRVTGGATFSRSMLEEMAASSDYPCILLGS